MPRSACWAPLLFSGPTLLSSFSLSQLPFIFFFIPTPDAPVIKLMNNNRSVIRLTESSQSQGLGPLQPRLRGLCSWPLFYVKQLVSQDPEPSERTQMGYGAGTTVGHGGPLAGAVSSGERLSRGLRLGSWGITLLLSGIEGREGIAPLLPPGSPCFVCLMLCIE